MAKEEIKEEIKEEPKIIGNKTPGYGYKYANLADIAKAGVKLPPMRVATLVDGEQNPVLDGKGNPIEYIEVERVLMNENGEIVREGWIRGARIVVPSGNKMNEAQAYGAALTYARRYSVLTVLGIACTDDDKIEVHSKEEAESQQLWNMTNELKDLYKKAGGKDFDKWVKDCGGISDKTYMSMKTTLIKQINDKAEKEKKDE